jgi:DNA-directed RNA polymerase subunit H (RpoH/RPB5)
MSLWHADPVKRGQVCLVLCEMIEDRGYHLVGDDAALTGDERRHLREMPIVGQNSDGELIAVHYVTEPKMSVKSLRKLVGITNACRRLECIIAVVHDCVTHFAVREQRTEERIQIFKYSEVSFNVTQHVSVPRHVRVPDNDIPRTLKRLMVKRKEMPTMSVSDPQVRYHGWPVGTLVCIHRELFGLSQLYYRLVVP